MPSCCRLQLDASMTRADLASVARMMLVTLVLEETLSASVLGQSQRWPIRAIEKRWKVHAVLAVVTCRDKPIM
ncbi:hypothetical protein CCR96_19665 [Halochromatium roseum]|nr:hypothetical protein [Halochromatium roseum]